jgi:hypothetical protein
VGGSGVLGAPNSVRLCGVQGAHQLRARAGRHEALFQGTCQVQDREGHNADPLQPALPLRPRSQYRRILHHRCAGERRLMDVNATGWTAGGSLMQVGNAHLTNRSTRPPSGRRVTSTVMSLRQIVSRFRGRADELERLQWGFLRSREPSTMLVSQGGLR